MLESVSPYALLRASIPKNNAAPTAYDLYSLAQSPQPLSQTTDTMQTAAVGPAKDRSPQTDAEPAPSAQAGERASSPMQPHFSTRKTHYISDIQTRHSAAVKRTTFSSVPQN